MSCNTSFTITPTMDELFYFKMDGFSANALPNSACDLIETNLNSGISNPTALVDGVIGHALSLNSTLLAASIWGPSLSMIMPLPTGMGGKDYTIRFWLKPNSVATFTLFQLTNFTNPNTNFDLIYNPSGIVTAGQHYVPIPPHDLNVSVTAPTPGSWFRVVITYKTATRTLSVQINNGTKVSASGDAFAVLGNGGWLISLMATNPPNCSLDEFYLEPGYAWTDAESTYDWNGGFGRTWPDVPQVFTHFFT